MYDLILKALTDELKRQSEQELYLDIDEDALKTFDHNSLESFPDQTTVDGVISLAYLARSIAQTLEEKEQDANNAS